MKLLFCPECHDVKKLGYEVGFCLCDSSWGWYESDGLHAVIGGEGIPIGFANDSFYDAIQHRPESGLGSRFEAFVIPRECDTVEEEG